MSTLLKDLKLQPQLALLYERYTREIYGVHYKVRHLDYNKFTVRGNELKNAGTLLSDYAERLLKYLKPWVLSKNWKYMPANVFLGSWAAQLYLTDIGNKTFEDISSDDETFQELVLDEFKIVALFLDSGLPVRQVIDTLWPMMSAQWRRLYEDGGRDAIIKDAFSLYRECTGSRYQTYADVHHGR